MWGIHDRLLQCAPKSRLFTFFYCHIDKVDTINILISKNKKEQFKAMDKTLRKETSVLEYLSRSIVNVLV